MTKLLKKNNIIIETMTKWYKQPYNNRKMTKLEQQYNNIHNDKMIKNTIYKIITMTQWYKQYNTRNNDNMLKTI